MLNHQFMVPNFLLGHNVVLLDGVDLLVVAPVEGFQLGLHLAINGHLVLKEDDEVKIHIVSLKCVHVWV